jgi:hypothetical protein
MTDDYEALEVWRKAKEVHYTRSREIEWHMSEQGKGTANQAAAAILRDHVEAKLAEVRAERDADAIALDGYRAAACFIGADSWDGCSDCMDILKAAKATDIFYNPTTDDTALALRNLRSRYYGVAPQMASQIEADPSGGWKTALADRDRTIAEQAAEITRLMDDERAWGQGYRAGENKWAEAVAEQAAELDRLHAVMERCAVIVDRNLYHQREKVDDVPRLLRSAIHGGSNAK